MDLSLSSKVGLRAVAYYMATTVLAVILGIILVVTIRPGDGGIDADELQESVAKRNITTAYTLMDLLRQDERYPQLTIITTFFRNCFLPNIVQATLQQYKTVLIYPVEDDVRYVYKVLDMNLMSVLGHRQCYRSNYTPRT
jgi:Na+/H+-dicarboxylate symporter